MSAKQFETLGRYISNAADILLLQNWEIVLSRFPCTDPEAAAQIYVEWASRFARVEVASGWNAYKPDRKRQYVAHELLHIYEKPIFITVEKAIRNATGELGWHMMEPGIRRERELMVDSLSFVVAKLLPEYPQ
jgi:hypothetical protein